MDSWRTWATEPKKFAFGGEGKRRHAEVNCLACRAGAGWHEGLHNLTAYQPESLESEKHDIPWEEKTETPILTEVSRHDEKWDIDVV